MMTSHRMKVVVISCFLGSQHRLSAMSSKGLEMEPPSNLTHSLSFSTQSSWGVSRAKLRRITRMEPICVPESLHVTGPTFRCGSWRDYWERPNENCLSSTLPSRSNSKDATFGTPGLTRNKKLGAPGIATNGARTLHVEFSIDDCPRCSGLDPERGV